MVEDVDSVRESRCSPGKKRGSGNESGECRGRALKMECPCKRGEGNNRISEIKKPSRLQTITTDHEFKCGFQDNRET